MMAIRSRWAAAVLVVVAATAGCGAERQATPSSGSATAESSLSNGYVGGPAIQLYGEGERTSPKPVTGELLDGSSFDLLSLRGTVTVINWWGSWCAPCRQETPHLVQAYNATRGLGVEFLGVDVRDSREAASSFAADYQVPYRSIFDPAGRVALAFTEVPPAAVPTTVVLDRSGRVAVAYRKAIGQGDLEPLIRRVAAEPAPTDSSSGLSPAPAQAVLGAGHTAASDQGRADRVIPSRSPRPQSTVCPDDGQVALNAEPNSGPAGVECAPDETAVAARRPDAPPSLTTSACVRGSLNSPAGLLLAGLSVRRT